MTMEAGDCAFVPRKWSEAQSGPRSVVWVGGLEVGAAFQFKTSAGK